MSSELLKTAYNNAQTKHRDKWGGTLETHAEIADLWSLYLANKLEAKDVAVMMALLKIVRIRKNPKEKDSWEDAVNYLAIGWDCLEAEIPRGEKGMKGEEKKAAQEEAEINPCKPDRQLSPGEQIESSEAYEEFIKFLCAHGIEVSTALAVLKGGKYCFSCLNRDDCQDFRQAVFTLKLDKAIDVASSCETLTYWF